MTVGKPRPFQQEVNGEKNPMQTDEKVVCQREISFEKSFFVVVVVGTEYLKQLLFCYSYHLYTYINNEFEYICFSYGKWL